MDPLQNDIWAHLGHATDPEPAAGGAATGAPGPDARARSAAEPVAPEPSAPAPGASAPGASEQRATPALRRRFDRGGRRRTDWPEDAGLTCCPGCGFERIQSLGALDSGDYLWQCPQCDRRFQTGRATRTGSGPFR